MRKLLGCLYIGSPIIGAIAYGIYIDVQATLVVIRCFAVAIPIALLIVYGIHLLATNEGDKNE